MSENRPVEQSQQPVERLRTEEPQPAPGEKEPDPDVVSDKTAEEAEPGAPVEPTPSGYGERDPKSEMPVVSSVPETKEDPREHDAEPPKRKQPTSPGYEE